MNQQVYSNRVLNQNEKIENSLDKNCQSRVLLKKNLWNNSEEIDNFSKQSFESLERIPSERLENFSKQSFEKELEFEEILKETEDPNFNGGFYGLPNNPSGLDISKFNIQQEILRFQREQNLTDEEIAKKMKLTLAETSDLLFGKINLFTLDRIMTHANSLFSNRLETVIIRGKSNFLPNQYGNTKRASLRV